LLIATDWQFRTLVRAQLLEQGYDVTAFPSLDIALGHLLRGGERPQAIILDAAGGEIAAQKVSDLWQLAGPVPLLVCSGAFYRATRHLEELPPYHLLRRPFRVRDVVERVQGLLACSDD
jgi:DNA-binding response OmpR family regulator